MMLSHWWGIPDVRLNSSADLKRPKALNVAVYKQHCGHKFTSEVDSPSRIGKVSSCIIYYNQGYVIYLKLVAKLELKPPIPHMLDLTDV